MMEVNPKHIFVFDFDGVICDSARETGISAWKAGRRIWPEWTAEMPPEDCLRRFCQLRPNLETGYQAIGLMKMAVDTDKTADDLTIGETIAWIDHLYQRAGVTREQMIDLFGKTRDAWIAAEPTDWLGRHAFYPGMRETLECLRKRGEVIILSTKQERFIRELLRGNAVDLSPENIYGLERKAPKKETLARLLAADGQPSHVCFVEDRYETLLEIIPEPVLDGVTLFFAAWGYNTHQQRLQARRNDRIQLIQLSDVPDIFLT